MFFIRSNFVVMFLNSSKNYEKEIIYACFNCGSFFADINEFLSCSAGKMAYAAGRQNSDSAFSSDTRVFEIMRKHFN